MSTPSAASARFDALVESYYRAWFRFHPEEAVDTGTAGYGHLLTPFRPEDLGPLVCLNDELRVGLDEIDEAQLNEDRRLDAKLLRGATVVENKRILEIDPVRIDPQRLLPINAIYQLTIREVEHAREAMNARLAAVPRHLAEVKDFVRANSGYVPSLWLRNTATAARAGAEFVAALPTNADFCSRFSPADDVALYQRAAEALHDLAQFASENPTTDGGGDFACGTEYFDLLLNQRHFLDVSVDSLRALGSALIEQTTRDLADACRVAGTDLPGVLRILQRDHPSSAGLIADYREAMTAARQFVATHDLVTLPSRESLEVIETPTFLRHQIPFAAYQEPAPNDARQRGYYYVTPPGTEEELAEHDYAGLMHTCVHEAWPGHHLQFVTANLGGATRSLPRLLNPSATLYEGWALYSEQLMHEQGFLDRPLQRVVLLRDRLWRALRILIDIDLHTAGLSVADAAERLIQHLGFARSQAMAEVTWYTRSPTVPLGYATGWSMINALRDRLRAEEPGMSLQSFHDRLLSVGSVALPLVIARAFGHERWSAVRGMLFP